MNVFKSFRDSIVAALGDMAQAGQLADGLDYTRVSAEPPRERSHGDIATNAAMVLAKRAGQKPRDLAENLAARLRDLPSVEKVEIAGPGFINVALDSDVWRGCLRDILKSGTRYGDSTIGAGQTVNVEFVSANPTGPLTVGHARGAVVGDALASLIAKAGYKVIREYYINDAGAQVDVLARSAYLRYREALGEDIGEIPEGLYPGEYLKDVGKALAARDGGKWLGTSEETWLPEVRRFAIDALMDLVRQNLAALGVRHDVFSSERSLVENGGVEAAIKTLQDRDLVYVGVLEPPKGKKPDDWEPVPLTLFKATDFGDDVDRPLLKSDGSLTYFANDIAYHLDKFNRGGRTMINVWGADHGGYVKRMQAAVSALTGGEGVLDVKICQLVKLMRGGEMVKMSKRSGNFVTLQEVIDEVGKDVVRFIMLTRKNDATLDFDLENVLEKSRDNPVFYVNYAHARSRSVAREAAQVFSGLALDDVSLASSDLKLLTDSGELAVMKLLAEWPRLVESAAEAHEPHRVAFYLYDLAAAFHGLWHSGNDNAHLRFIRPGEPELTQARLALVRSVAVVIASGLEVFGVEPAEEMH
ncbi:arginine--tRNA ligase [Denitrobaculum tricleocarpae]|uniref:Arginine--tRNA ligase n=1 Tax=Denitrobaculum tricleocarpae TaxID=2591009 RepID=A0A545TQ02_9PROT|nr:arginine--tRNA ligase [Denitrobaculum tricleocarpae]TQV79305.1 arginine--tRNA ligase [Denitrobaculum tricleocarpae]